MFRREWRQQALVLALLTVAVAAAIGGATAAYNTGGVADDAEFGAATHLLRWERPPPDALRTDTAAAREWFGTAELVTRWRRPVPGSVEHVEFRALDPRGALVAPTVALRDGHYPSGPEVAVTDGVARLFDLRPGDVFDLDGVPRPVVGVVENPSDLDQEFALVAPGSGDRPEQATLLVAAGSGEVGAFQASGRLRSEDLTVSERGHATGTLAAATVLGVAGAVMVLVALLAAAGFVVVAQKRLRQIGMLAALGATEHHLRLVMVANGVALGSVASVAGLVAGLGGWLLAAPRMEAAVGHRIDPLDVPWWLVVTAMLLALAAATAAAWWPARVVARVPPTRALTGRPPAPRPARRSALLAVLLLGGGLGCLAAGRDGGDASAALALAGTVASLAGVLLLSPFAVRVLGVTARWLGVGARLALRDLARFQARSSAAVAAVTLAVGLPAAVVVTASAAEHGPDEGNVSDRQLLVWTRNDDDPEGVSPFYSEDEHDSGFAPFPPDLTPAELATRERQVDEMARRLDDAVVTPLDVAVDPDMEPGPHGRPAVTLARRTSAAGGGWLDIALLYVATPALVERYGVDLAGVDGDVDVLTVEGGAVSFTNAVNDRTGNFAGDPVEDLQRLRPSYSSLPGSFITPRALAERGWTSTRIGWLVEAGGALGDEQLAEARELAAGAGLLVERRTDESELRQLNWGATVAGIGVAAAVVAMTVGLVRGEAAGDLRTLTATGATTRVRRRITSTTAGAVALAGAVLGCAGAYAALAAGYLDRPGSPGLAGLGHLLLIGLGLPGAAAVAGWLLAGRQPSGLGRRSLD